MSGATSIAAVDGIMGPRLGGLSGVAPALFEAVTIASVKSDGNLINDG